MPEILSHHQKRHVTEEMSSLEQVRDTIPSTLEARKIAGLFRVLSDPTRLQILYALLYAPQGELCVSDLALAMKRDDTTISHQLSNLRKQHVVTVRRSGRMMYYRLVDAHIRELLVTGKNHASEPFES